MGSTIRVSYSSLSGVVSWFRCVCVSKLRFYCNLLEYLKPSICHPCGGLDPSMGKKDT